MREYREHNRNSYWTLEQVWEKRMRRSWHAVYFLAAGFERFFLLFSSPNHQLCLQNPRLWHETSWTSIHETHCGRKRVPFCVSGAFLNQVACPKRRAERKMKYIKQASGHANNKTDEEDPFSHTHEIFRVPAWVCARSLALYSVHTLLPSCLSLLTSGLLCCRTVVSHSIGWGSRWANFADPTVCIMYLIYYWHST
jgi:hypothetical protein